MQALRNYAVYFFVFLVTIMGTTAAGNEVTSSSPISDQESACEKEDFQSCYFLAQRYSLGLDVGLNSGTAINYWYKACDGGHGRSCFSLGSVYLAAKTFGSSTIETPEDSVILGLIDKSCELGEMDGCAYMGAVYADGDGVEKDVSKSISYFQKACDGGHAKVCSGAGLMFIKGSTFPMDKEKGRAFLQKGCDLGEMQACKYLNEN